MQNEDYSPIDFPFPQDKTKHIIKVIGVGGGGGNAVKNMFQTGVKNVGFAVCNTDSQSLSKSPVPIKVQLGEGGLGVGGDPQKGREAAENSLDVIMQLLDEDTKMVFITAGMGGGTGTGASPVIAKAARERGLLTIGVVTLPFLFERRVRIEKALSGIAELKKNVDALLVINNERLLEMYNDNMTTIEDAFLKADEVLTIATKTIAEIITDDGIVNRDFCDVETVMKESGAAIVSVGYAEGENRVLKAMTSALSSPLLNPVDIEKTQRLLYIIYTGKDKPVTISETAQINQFMDSLSPNLLMLWGLYRDESLGDKVKVAIVATGFDHSHQPESNDKDDDQARAIRKLEEFYYPQKYKKADEPAPEEVPTIVPQESDNPTPENGTQTSYTSWLKSILEFARRTFEEDE